MSRKRRETHVTGYDLTFITKSDLADEKLKALKDKIEAIIKQYSGDVLEWQDLGKKRFAYPIQKEVKGQYTAVIFTGKGDVVTEIERNLRINEGILRFLAVKISENFTPELYTNLIEERKRALAEEQEEQEGQRSSGMKDDRKMMTGRALKKKECRLTKFNLRGKDLDYKDARLLQSFMTEHGRLVPRRVSGNTALNQRKLTTAIKRARILALVGFVSLGSHY